MSVEHLTTHCAPTLAGLKTGSLFTCAVTPTLLRDLDRWNRQLRGKGVCVRLLHKSETRALVYVYRPRQLARDLARPEVASFLRELGYPSCQPGACLRQLSEKCARGGAFPHEIGLFLGYPLEDVRGFIQRGPRACKLVGSWKVYGDVAEARRRFQQFDKCTRVYCQKLREGFSIDRLTVAA